jgi:hypothetical protein
MLESKMTAISKENIRTLIIHTIGIIVVSNAMLSGSRNSLKCLVRVYADCRINETKIQIINYQIPYEMILNAKFHDQLYSLI